MKKDIIKAYLFLREHEHTIPSETLDYIKDAALKYDKLESLREAARAVVEDAVHCGGRKLNGHFIIHRAFLDQLAERLEAVER